LERLESTLAAGPHILHFVGHGKFSQRRGEAALYLQDAAGNTKIITEAQLVAMLRRQAAPPHLIFLAACQSAERSTADAFAGLAPKLVQAGVPAVVAMRARVAMGTARRLSRVFYSELVARGAVDRALNAARSALLTTGCS
jgi:CHAT domain-containing protein